MNWSAFLTLNILATAIHWTIARSQIMRWFWGSTWLPELLRDLLECPACSGFWIGLGLGLAGLRPLGGPWWWGSLAAGALALFGTPIAEGLLLWGLDRSRM